MADEPNTTFNIFPQSYHAAWLSAHPGRSLEWLREKMREGFHIHHVDGNHENDDPSNLVLIDGLDHLGLHAGGLTSGIKLWRKLNGHKAAQSLARGRKAKVAAQQAKIDAFRAMNVPEIVSRSPEPQNAQGVPAGLVQEARRILASGGTEREVLAALHEESGMGWKRLRIHLRRELAA